MLPMAAVPLDIAAEVRGVDPDRPDELTTVRGQVAGRNDAGRSVEAVHLEPRGPAGLSEAVAAVEAADWVVLGPGSWFTSVHPAPAGARAAPTRWCDPAARRCRRAQPRRRAGGDGRVLTRAAPGGAGRARAATCGSTWCSPTALRSSTRPTRGGGEGSGSRGRGGRPGARDGTSAPRSGRRSPSLWRRSARDISVAAALMPSLPVVAVSRASRGRCQADRAGTVRGRIGPMAMTAQVKAELASTSVTKSCCRKSEVSSMLRFAGGLHIVSGRIVVEAELDTGAAARRLRRDIAEVYGHRSEVVVVSRGGIRRHAATSSGWPRTARRSPARPGCSTAAADPCAGCRRRSSAGAVCDAVAAWRGAFLAHGSLTEPGRSSALEVTCPGPEAALALVGAARRSASPPRPGRSAASTGS